MSVVPHRAYRICFVRMVKQWQDLNHVLVTPNLSVAMPSLDAPMKTHVILVNHSRLMMVAIPALALIQALNQRRFVLKSVAHLIQTDVNRVRALKPMMDAIPASVLSLVLNQKPPVLGEGVHQIQIDVDPMNRFLLATAVILAVVRHLGCEARPSTAQKKIAPINVDKMLIV